MKYVPIALIVLAVLTALGYGAKLVRDAERAEQLRIALELVKERDKIDARNKTATDADICFRLGGKWVPDENRCG